MVEGNSELDDSMMEGGDDDPDTGQSGSSDSGQDSSQDNRTRSSADDGNDDTSNNGDGGNGDSGQDLTQAEEDADSSFDDHSPDQTVKTCGQKTITVADPSDPNPKTFIEIELVDEQGNPVPGEAFEITLPDGSVVDGSLDGNGQTRVDGIDPGSCQITFPDLDTSAWKNA